MVNIGLETVLQNIPVMNIFENMLEIQFNVGTDKSIQLTSSLPNQQLKLMLFLMFEMRDMNY